MARRKQRGPKDPTEVYDFSITGCEFWTNVSGGTRRDPTGSSSSLAFNGVLATPIRGESAIELVVYRGNEDAYQRVDDAPAYVERSAQRPIGWLDLLSHPTIAIFLPASDFDRLTVMAAAGKVLHGHVVMTPLKYRRAEVRNLSLASRPIE